MLTRIYTKTANVDCNQHWFATKVRMHLKQLFKQDFQKRSRKQNQTIRILCKSLNVPAPLAADRSSRRSGSQSETSIVRRWSWLQNGCVWHMVRERLLPLKPHVKGEDEREAGEWQNTKLIPRKLQRNLNSKLGNWVKKNVNTVFFCASMWFLHQPPDWNSLFCLN